MSSLSILLEMGFTQTKAEKALAETGNLGVEQAMEWLLAHADDPDNDEPIRSDPANSEEPAVAEDEATADKESEMKDLTDQGDGAAVNSEEATAKSYKCDDCGKMLKSDGDLEFHATKTGHLNFSESTEEIKPLSEEEKKERIRQLEDRIKQRRLEKEAHDRREQIEREKMRRRTGQEISEAKKKLEEEEIKRIADERKKEKLEAKMARQKILEQIERDKQARREKFGGGGVPVPVEPQVASSTFIPTPQETATPSEASISSQKKEYETTKIQIRLPTGTVLTQTFGSKEELAAVRLYVQMNQTAVVSPFSMMTNFPKRVFTDEDMEKPLYELGLVPTAVLIVSKK